MTGLILSTETTIRLTIKVSVLRLQCLQILEPAGLLLRRQGTE